MPWTHWGFWILPLAIAAVLAIPAAIVSHRSVRPLYTKHFPEARRERLFLASIGFFTAVFVVRGITFAIHNGIGPFHDVSMKGRHIHHLVWGIALLLLVGYGWLLKIGTGAAESLEWVGRLMSMLYGVASALTLDEFALWLNLRDVYWEREGQASLEAMALFGALLCIGILGGPFFRGVGRKLLHPFRRGE